MKPEAVRQLTTLFVVPVTILTIARMGVKFIDTKKRKICLDCYGGMEIDITFAIMAIVYLLMLSSGVGKSIQLYVFYVVLIMAVLMFGKLVRQLISKIRMMYGQTATSIGAEAAAKVAVGSAQAANSVAEAKQKGGESGAKAASEAAISAGLSDSEVIEAVVAGKETGEIVAEKVAVLSF